MAKKKLTKLAKKGQAIQTYKDVTLRDTSKFILFEYSVPFLPSVLILSALEINLLKN